MNNEVMGLKSRDDDQAVALQSVHAQGQLQGLVLRSGMPAEVFIETGHRSMISYLTKPFMDQFMRAFRDN